jgi:8-oxo-dGTP pyrophosphatase MutT (NUDIX family)
MMMRLDAHEVRRRLAERTRQELHLDGFRESAVLVPIVVEPGQDDRLLFTVRRADLATHGGQISFPGGKRDPGDIDLVSTAIREAAEELGIAPANVEVLGLLDDVPTPSKYVITPVVARVVGPLTLHPSAHEVAEVFSPPLDALANPACYTHAGVRTFLGISYAMHEYRWEKHNIWGATARMVHQLLEILDAASATAPPQRASE